MADIKVGDYLYRPHNLYSGDEGTIPHVIAIYVVEKISPKGTKINLRFLYNRNLEPYKGSNAQFSISANAIGSKSINASYFPLTEEMLTKAYNDLVKKSTRVQNIAKQIFKPVEPVPTELAIDPEVQ